MAQVVVGVVPIDASQMMNFMNSHTAITMQMGAMYGLPLPMGAAGVQAEPCRAHAWPAAPAQHCLIQAEEPEHLGNTGDIRGRILALSRNPQGCRIVQHHLETGSPEVRQAAAWELHGHILALTRCPQGNYVVQKLIECATP